MLELCMISFFICLLGEGDSVPISTTIGIVLALLFIMLILVTVIIVLMLVLHKKNTSEK